MNPLRALISQLRWRTKIAIRRPPLAVYCWIGANPYQDLLYSRFEGRLAPERLYTIRHLGMFGFYSGSHRSLLHVHWEQAYAWSSDDEATRHRRFARMGRALQDWKSKGGRIAWTLHDPAALLDGEEERLPVMRDRLKALADMIHVHSQSARAFATDTLGLPPERIVVIAHPSYLTRYPPAPARTALPTGAAGPRLLCFGAVKPYKNFDGLGRVLDTLPPHSFRSLRIAGSVSSGGQAPQVAPRSVDTLARDLRWISDDEIPGIFADADFLVLPYTQSLTSGAALMAMTFGVPVIAPDFGSMRESIPVENAPLLYDPAAGPDAEPDAEPDTENGLAEALGRARGMTSADYAALSAACLAHAHKVHPHIQSQQLLDALRARSLL